MVRDTPDLCEIAEQRTMVLRISSIPSMLNMISGRNQSNTSQLSISYIPLACDVSHGRPRCRVFQGPDV